MLLEHLAGVTTSEASGFHFMFVNSKVALDAIISSSFQSLTLLLPTFNSAGEFVLDLIVDLEHVNAVPVNYSCIGGWICYWLVGKLCIQNSILKMTIVPLDP